ncbi:PREDICTED: vicilin-like antimicrobial peptides 2-2 [Nelumbo nucifera]|uniref:Cupin type-1 domain-containing protein n=2 Tax=Nelumbo nucifera TaxID=4432 RepID=A0A822XKE0_NELNU|nr:PREDICTED: vicilin-like antimicrobial peptides 2-2 [Nelumbo nucifera]DAD19601.1 TPA_asm: hypothetical protein HUJ06_021064 [Nelumbo nucifera]
MVIKAKLSLLLFLVSFHLLLSALSLAGEVEDPELQQCQHQCQHQEHFDEEKKQYCKEKCEKYIIEKHYQQCQQLCDQGRGEQEKQLCRQGCEQRHRQQQKEQDERQREHCAGGSKIDKSKSKGSQEEQEGNNPYLFDEKSFKTRFQTEEGNIKVLERFSERLEFLRGIESYRLAIIKASPNTFVTPCHEDADVVFFVTWGRGVITLVRNDNRESFKIQKGDVMMIPAGTVVYFINNDNHEKLFIAKLLLPISTPGHFEAFFGPGGENPESFYRAFSTEVLEAALNVRKDKLKRLLGRQDKGVIIKASDEQIKSLSQHASSRGGQFWPFDKRETKGPFNLFNKRPSQSNNYGQFYEVKPGEFKQLQGLDIAVSFLNISSGAMSGPYYNSRATKVAVVIEGNGYYEMACPHSSSSSGGRHGGSEGGSSSRFHHHQDQGGVRYRKMSGFLAPESVFLVPAGHPVVTVASSGQNLQIVCFEIKGEKNEKYMVAGENNIIKYLEKEAKELSYNIPAKEVDEILSKQSESLFFPGPERRQEWGGRADE